MKYEEKVQEFAESIKDFFLYFDSVFLEDPYTWKMLEDTMNSLKEKVSRNETALPLIIAMGGSYDGNIDRAKIKEAEALLSLIQARKEVRAATQEQFDSKKNSAELLRFFGV